MKTIQDLEKIILAYKAKIDIRLEKAQIKNIKLTPDKFGRYHAPFDGYEEDGITYLGGQYLPEESISPAGKKIRFKISTSLIDDVTKLFIDNFDRIEKGSVFFGQPWKQKEGDVCYAYIESLPESIIRQIEGYLFVALDIEIDLGQHYFENKEKVQIEIVSSETIYSINGYYRQTWLKKLLTSDNILLYYKGGLTEFTKALFDLEDNLVQSIKIKGTIEHSTYNGTKQTHIKNVRLNKKS